MSSTLVEHFSIGFALIETKILHWTSSGDNNLQNIKQFRPLMLTTKDMGCFKNLISLTMHDYMVSFTLLFAFSIFSLLSTTLNADFIQFLGRDPQVENHYTSIPFRTQPGSRCLQFGGCALTARP